MELEDVGENVLAIGTISIVDSGETKFEDVDEGVLSTGTVSVVDSCGTK